MIKSESFFSQIVLILVFNLLWAASSSAQMIDEDQFSKSIYVQNDDRSFNSLIPSEEPINLSDAESIYDPTDKTDSLNLNRDRKTTSLTAGYISDTFSLQSADGTYRFRFAGETTGLMWSSNSSSLMLSYGMAGAHQDGGDIRSIAADLNFGGNITLFRKFLGLPIGSFIPIRFNMGYRNLELMDNTDPDLSSTANIGTGSLGGGLGAEIRIPTGLPVLKDNLTAFAYLARSVGAIGDFASLGGNSEINTLNGIRLTKSTDLNIEAKFERLLGGNTGVTAGLTIRKLYWTNQDAEDAKQILDIISGKQEGLELRATQTFFRVGINW